MLSPSSSLIAQERSSTVVCCIFYLCLNIWQVLTPYYKYLYPNWPVEESSNNNMIELCLTRICWFSYSRRDWSSSNVHESSCSIVTSYVFMSLSLSSSLSSLIIEFIKGTSWAVSDYMSSRHGLLYFLVVLLFPLLLNMFCFLRSICSFLFLMRWLSNKSLLLQRTLVTAHSAFYVKSILLNN